MLLATLLLLAALLYVVVRHWSRHERRALGLERGDVLAADNARSGAPTLCSERLGLTTSCAQAAP